MRKPTAAACLLFALLLVACKSEVSGRCPPCPSAPACNTAISPMVVSSALPLDLPKAAQGNEVNLVLAVELHANGELRANDKVLRDMDALLALARAEAAANPDLRAVIRADRVVQHGRVIAVLDILKQAGITKIAFGVTPLGSAAP